eukprot:8083417-Alexandrium_andersonii.AAC.1
MNASQEVLRCKSTPPELTRRHAKGLEDSLSDLWGGLGPPGIPARGLEGVPIKGNQGQGGKASLKKELIG